LRAFRCINRQQSKAENRDVKVRVHTEGTAPYIPIRHDQLDDLTRMLDANGIRYTVADERTSEKVNTEGPKE
jgi:hypothetical protein